MLNDLVFRLYALSAVILTLQMFGLAAFTGGARKKHLNPEDVKLFKSELVQSEEDRLARILRLHRNMVENNLPFFIIGMLFASVGGPLLMAEICFGIYVLTRFSHMFAYLKAIQPLRRASWGIGLATTTVLALYVGYRAILGA